MNGRIKTNWAALSAAEDGRVIVCLKQNDSPQCLVFESLKALEKKIESRRISVANWAVSIPRDKCIIKNITLPASNIAEAAKMVEFEIPSLVPLSANEMVYGCVPLSKDNNMMNLLVCILKLNSLEKLLEPYQKAGIRYQRVVLDTLAIRNWFDGAEDKKDKPKIGVFICHNKCVFSSICSDNLDGVDELHFADEEVTISANKIANRIQEHCEKLPAKQRGISLLIGGRQDYLAEVQKSLDGFLSNSASNRVTTVASPEVKPFEAVQTEAAGIDYTLEAIQARGLLDIATGFKYPHLNLLPQQEVRKREKRAKLVSYTLAGFEAVMVVFLLWLCLWAMNWRLGRLSEKIELQIKPIENIAGGVELKRQRLTAVHEQFKGQGLIGQMLIELYEHTPKSISLSGLSFTSRKGEVVVEMKGQAKLLSEALEYPDAMNKAELLKNIQVTNAQQVPRPGGSIVEFKANCVIQIK